MGTDLNHIPVLAQEVLELLDPQPGQVYVDATAGLGGHAADFAARVGPEGLIVLNDLDQGNLARARERVERALEAMGGDCPGIEAIGGNYADLPRKLAEMGIGADMVLADLGFASTQVDDPERGFSFKGGGPLDMRFDQDAPVTAAELVNTLPEDDLVQILREFGEERNARRIAQKLVVAREAEPIATTARLAEVVRSAFPGSARAGRIDPATRTFQAIRIAVNDELGSLGSFLDSVGRAASGRATGTATWLKPGARVAVICFHSLEDRPVKRAFAAMASGPTVELLTRKPVRASEQEQENNRRARSAKLRGVRLG